MQTRIRFFTPADNEPAPNGLPTPCLISNNQHRAWSADEKQFLCNNWQRLTNQEIATAIKRSLFSVNSMGSELGLTRTAEANSIIRSRRWQYRKSGKSPAWSADEIQFLRDNWQTMTTIELASHLGRNRDAIKVKGQRELKLRKTHQALSAISKRLNVGQFKKGNISSNAILDEVMPIRTRHHHKKQGGYSYKWIRVAWKKWIHYHVWLWEHANGPVPQGMIIVFKNKDTMDCRLDNLELITRKEHALRNSGSLNLPDGYVAHLMAVRNPEQRTELLKYPELIDLKRTQIKFNRLIKTP